jgi:hypothetical protein
LFGKELKNSGLQLKMHFLQRINVQIIKVFHALDRRLSPRDGRESGDSSKQ